MESQWNWSMYGLCGQLLLTMFTFIFWPSQIIKATTCDGNRLGNEMYSNMLAVLFLCTSKHTFFSIFLLYFLIRVCLYQLLSLSSGSFCSFMAKPCQISFFVCQLLSLTLPDTISTSSKLSWQMTWPAAEHFPDDCLGSNVFALCWGGAMCEEIIWLRRVKFKTHFNYGNLTWYFTILFYLYCTSN